MVGDLVWEMAVVTDGGKESEGEERMAKKETHKQDFLLSGLNIFWGWQCRVFSSSGALHPSTWGQAVKQERALYSKRSGEAHSTGAIVGTKTGDVSLIGDSYLREVGTLLCV